jgi:hypothetical protein
MTVHPIHALMCWRNADAATQAHGRTVPHVAALRQVIAQIFMIQPAKPGWLPTPEKSWILAQFCRLGDSFMRHLPACLSCRKGHPSSGNFIPMRHWPIICLGLWWGPIWNILHFCFRRELETFHDSFPDFHQRDRAICTADAVTEMAVASLK